MGTLWTPLRERLHCFTLDLFRGTSKYTPKVFCEQVGEKPRIWVTACLYADVISLVLQACGAQGNFGYIKKEKHTVTGKQNVCVCVCVCVCEKARG